MSKKVFCLCLLFLGFLSRPLAAGGGKFSATIQERCHSDELAGPSSDGRNAWALQCGAIDQKKHDLAVGSGLYWTFSHPRGQRAPWTVDAACDPDFTIYALCPNLSFAE